MSYENAPATYLLATHCICCGKPLVDSASVEAGIGPVCRKKSGYASEVTEENRQAANKLIHKVSTTTDTDEKVEALNALFDLGLVQVVTALLKSVATVKIATTPVGHKHGAGRLAVKVPYSGGWDSPEVQALRKVPGQWWDKESKCNTFPQSSKGALWAVLKQYHHGEIGVGPKGVFKVAPQAKTQSQTPALKLVG